MNFFENYINNLKIFLYIISFNLIFSNNNTLNTYGMKFAKSLKLYNGYIITAGDIGISIYDSTGMISIYNYTEIEDSIDSEDDGYFTTLVQFPKEYNGLVIVFIINTMYIFDFEAHFKFKKKIDNISFTSFIKFYSFVPYIYKDGNYHIILGYINESEKVLLQYYLINLESESVTLVNYYSFDQDDYLNDFSYNYGVSCQIMNHHEYGKILTCFYQLNNNPKEISAISFNIINNRIEKIQGLNTSYEDVSFCIQSAISEDKKKSLVCYIQNDDDEGRQRNGFCNIYNIDENKFGEKFRCLTSSCEANINHISLNYFRETKEYIFSCTGTTSDINIMRFDQNFNIISINNGIQIKEDSIISISGCHYPYFYSIIFLISEYTILGDFSCDGDMQSSTLYSIPEEYKPSVIYSDSFEQLEDTEKKENSDTISESQSTSISSTYKTICNEYKNIEGTLCSNIIPNGYYLLNSLNKIIEKCHISCEKCEKGPDAISNNCLTCHENFELNKISNCLYKYNYFFNETIDEIIYLLANQFCPEILPYEIIETKECVKNCEIDEFIDKKCKINYISENNLKSITDNLRKIIYKSNNSNYDVIIDGNNIIYEITTSEVKNDYNNISSIDFGECGKILKNHYSINYLIIFKSDIKMNDLYPIKVEYEVYSPEKKQKLNLSLCENNKIDIYIPTSLDNYTNELYESISKYGYDIFNENSSFYKDLCTPFTTEEGTDILLYDRQFIYHNDIPLCESNCIYKFYNSTNKKAKCQCQIKEEFIEMKILSFENMNLSDFLDVKTISNIELLKCFKLTFSKEGLTNNYGNIIILIMISLYISLFIVFFFKKKTSVSKILRKVLKLNNYENNPPPKKSQKNLSILENSKSNNNQNNDNQSNGYAQQSNAGINIFQENNNNNKKKKKRKNKNKLVFKIKNYQNINVIKNANIIFKDEQQKNPTIKNNENKKTNLNNISVYNINEKNSKKNINKKIKDNENNNYIEEELNILEYKEAILYDKRTYLEYYWALLKKKHIILSIIISYNDYNLIYIKISLLIVNFCLYFSINALFFTDKTMHKIYEDKGIFKIFNQLPQIIYSSLISSLVNILIKQFGFSEKEVIELKKEKNKIKAFEKAALLYKNLIFKFNLYFLISLFILVICWYYVSTFCAVYKNTQLLLIENTLFCFGLTLIYPFILNLFPGIFRVPSLKASQQDKECLYKIGIVLALVL